MKPEDPKEETMSVIRANKNLSKMNDSQLNALVIVCVARGVDFAQVEEHAADWQGSGRKAVVYAACAFDLLISKLTETVVIAPSEESKLWSNLEGGHRFHVLPDLDLNAIFHN
jgi:hypothetical protein